MSNESNETAPSRVARGSDALRAANEKRKQRVAQGLSADMDPVERFNTRHKTRGLAIAAKCWDCMGAGADPNTKFAIRDCPSGSTCTLWTFRPFQKLKGAKAWVDGKRVI